MGKKMQKTPKSYDVGYGRPPKHTQFKPGTSGNPKGRPNGAPPVEDLLLREARKLVTVKIGGKVEKISKIEALVRQLFRLALEGDLQAARMVMSYLDLAMAGEEGSGDGSLASVFGAEIPDQKTLERITDRLAHIVSDKNGDADE